MKTGVFRDVISYVLAVALVLSPFGAPMSLHIPKAQAAVRVNQHYLKIENEDTISEALDRYFPCRSWRLWGKSGAVARVSALNPQIRDINKLHPGMLIDIGEYAKTPTCVERTPASLGQITTSKAQEPKIESVPEPQEREKVILSNDPIQPAQSIDAPVVKVAKDPVTRAKSPSERYGLLEVMPEFSYSRISSVDRSTGGSAIFSSSLMPGVRVAWGQHWSDKVQTYLNLGIRSESYVAPAGYSLENSSRTMTDFGLGIRWAPFKKVSDLAVDSVIEFRQENFARAVSLTSVKLDATMIPELALGVRYRVLNLSPFTSTLYARGLILFPQSTSTYSIQSGTGSVLGVTFTEDLSKTTQLSGSLQYSSRSQDTAIATQVRTDVGLSFGIIFKLGDSP